MRFVVVVGVLLLGAVDGRGQEKVMQPGPKSPGDSLACIKPRAGFTVELMAAEPLVQDPVAFAWGPGGKFWVVEMGDYPLGDKDESGAVKAGGRVKYLTKSKGGDGPYDQVTVFLEGLHYPTGVTPWGKGVLVTCAPDIFYAEDTDGDGKADTKTVLYTGFGEGNQQHRVNGLVWGLDNWLHGANGDSGGRVKSLRSGKTVDIRGRDFRIKPDAGLIEPTTGQTQFGRSRDDWGNWFGNNNSNPLYHFVLEDRYLRRNPHVVPPQLRVQVSVKPGPSTIYPISKPLPRFNNPQSVNHFTSACSAIFYRDTLFGPEFVGNSFVSEPVHNLVHREIVKPKGVTFTSQRAADEETSEFLASSDNWFRPTMIQVGPDGALWIADMYRFVIEHPQWIPQDWQKKLDLRAGHDLGRIYRVFPQGKKPRGFADLTRLSNNELVALLASPNGWTRDSAHRLLVERNDQAALGSLNALLKNENPLARVHALCVLDGMGRIDPREHAFLLLDVHAGVRKHAYRLLTWPTPIAPDEDVQARLQQAYSAANARNTGELLADIAVKDAGDVYLLTAALSSVDGKNWPAFFASVLRHTGKAPLPQPLLDPLFRLTQGLGSGRDKAKLLGTMIPAKGEITTLHVVTLADLLDALQQSNESLPKMWQTGDADLRRALGNVDRVFAKARRWAGDTEVPQTQRLLAIRLLGRGLDRQDEDIKMLADLLNPRTPNFVQSAVVGSLGELRGPRVAEALLGAWKTMPPDLRVRAADVLLSRSDWTQTLITALEARRILPLDIDAARRQRLLQLKDASLRERAAKALALAINADRSKVITAYRPVIQKKGDAALGAKVFGKNCAACHKLGDIGQEVGPNLASVGDKSAEGLLIAILDPNRAVETRYLNYVAFTSAGVAVNGLLKEETSTSITLVGPDGKAKTLLRRDIEELSSAGKSVMPEGFEKEITPADMIHLLAYLQDHLPRPQRKSFPGNEPATVQAEEDGSLRLLPANASIFGKTLVLEKQYANLGYWSSADDHVIWKVRVPRKTTYTVWLTWACARESAGNHFQLRLGTGSLTHQVESTGSWDNYRRGRVGEVTLEAGDVDIHMSPLGPLRGALLDLKEVRLVPKN